MTTPISNKRCILYIMIAIIGSLALACSDDDVDSAGIVIYEIVGPIRQVEGIEVYVYRATFGDSFDGGGQRFQYYLVVQEHGGDSILEYSRAYEYVPPFESKNIDIFRSDLEYLNVNYYNFYIVALNMEDEFYDWSAVHHYGGPKEYIIDAGFPNCNFALEVDTNGVPIDSYSCIFINDSALIPQIVACIPLEKSTNYVDWEIIITYNRSNRHDTLVLSETAYYQQCIDVNSLIDTMMAGGEARIKCRPEGESCEAIFDFRIRGQNPDTMEIINFIELQNDIWYNKYVARWEGGEQAGRRYLQFNEVGSYNCDTADIRHTPNWGEDCPTCPGGFGIFQLTNFRHPNGNWGLPSTKQLWSWKNNCMAGCNYLHYRQGDADNYMSYQRDTAIIDTGLSGYTVPVETVNNVIFQDGTNRHIEHAVALKRYNGLGIYPYLYGYDSTIYSIGNRQYCQWNRADKYWQFNRVAYYLRIDEVTQDTNLAANYYVNDICSQVP